MNTFRSLRRGALVAVVGLAASVIPAHAQAATLDLGACGNAVASLQRSLASVHYPTGGTDGCYGSATKHAVLAFQLANGLQADGVAGSRTLRALRDPKPVVARSRGEGAHVEVDRGRQLLLVVRDGGVTAIFAASTGKAGFTTPAGSFRVYRKVVGGWSNQYQAPMPYASYFVRGVAVHAGKIPGYPASHGCVRVPAAFAATLYRRMPSGSSVLVY